MRSEINVQCRESRDAPRSVAIILLNWHGWRDTLACLEALDSLDYPNARIIVVDNGSTDDSVARIRAARPNVRLLVNEMNLGFGGGCNTGIRDALVFEADYIWLLNNDTKAEPQALTALLEVAESSIKIGAVGSILYYMDEPERVQAWGGGYVDFTLGAAEHHYTKPPPGKLDYLTGASLLLKREVLEKVGLFDENFFMYWEDTDLGFRIRAAGWKIEIAERSIILHRESASLGRKSPVLTKYFNESAWLFFSKHAHFHGVIPIGIGTAGRILKACMRKDWDSVKQIVAVVCRRLFKSRMAA